VSGDLFEKLLHLAHAFIHGRVVIPWLVGL
jgi:hypothetical protein